MKTKARKLLLCLIALLLLLTAAPLTGLTGETLTPKAAAATYQVGDIITFGGYPQSKVTDSATLSALNALGKTWVSYGYYSGTGNAYDGKMQAGDWMRYADLLYKGAKYRAVTFDKYRPSVTGNTASTGNSRQGENGYKTGNVYYFKYESLRWRVLDPAAGLVLCERIIDSQEYQNLIYYDGSEYYQGIGSTTYANDYATSYIRRWLTEDFYNAAFSAEEKALIGETALDNSAYSTSYAKYNGAATTDKIYLPSYSDMLNTAYGFASSSGTANKARRAKGTDYAKCQDLYVSSSSDYAGNSYWRLRSSGSSSLYPTNVKFDGTVRSDSDVGHVTCGVRPAFRFKSGISQSLNPNGGYIVGDRITFGGYPQSQVTDSATISALDALDKPYISYRYFSGAGDDVDGQMQAGDWMRFADIWYEGTKYRAVTFDSYRPYYTGGAASAGVSHQDDNGYTPGNVYYFKYESLRWRVLDPAAGLVLCESIIDSQEYQNLICYDGSEYYQGIGSPTYANDYATSSIRAWLTEDFYNAAFSAEEKAQIGETALDNSAYSADYAKYNSASTTDKIYLLSYSDMLNTAYGFSASNSTDDTARRVQGTDYAKCQGLRVSTTSEYAGNSFWQLRSPGSSSRGAAYVGDDGRCYDNYDVHRTDGGVRPAFRFKSGISESLNPNGGKVVLPGPYTVSYDAVDGAGAPEVQTKTYGAALTLSSSVPVKSYTITWHANGGAVAPATDTRVCTFTGWNTAADGSGTPYAPGGSYTAEADATLYAQWQDPTFGTLPTPVRENYAFDGWYTAADGGTQVSGVDAVNGSRTLYAHWTYHESLTASSVTLYAATVEYNSKQRTPVVTVKNAAGVKLTEGTDYTVTVPAGRTIPGTYTYTVTGIGDYTGTVTKDFVIRPCTLKAENVTLYSATVEYNSKQRTPKVTVKSPWGVTLTEGTHYTVTLPEGRTIPGTYVYKITGKGRFTGTVDADFVIKPCTLTADNVSLYSATVEYNSKQRTPKVTVKSPWGVTLTEGTHYTVTLPEGRTIPGTYVYTITGKGRFTGTVNADFVIKRCTLLSANVSLYSSSVTYNGKVRTPKVTVKSPWGVTLTEGTHYTVTVPAGRTNAGNYVYKITGKGRFAGTVNADFVINPQALKAENVTLYAAEVTYNGKQRTPSVTVKNAAGETLTKGTDYTVTVPAGRTEPGTYVYTITGKGNYTGTVSANFVIRPAATANPTATLTATNNIAATQTVSLSMHDEDQLAGYYWGANADDTQNTYYSLADNATGDYTRKITLTEPGTYYFTVVNRKGLVSMTLSVTYYRTTLDPNGGTVMPTTLLNKAGVPITLPTPVKAGGEFERWSGDGEYTFDYTPTRNRDLIARYRDVDNLPPEITLTSTNYVDNEQTLTIRIEDDTDLSCYYWGTNPDHTKNERVTLGGIAAVYRITINTAGTYYFYAEDAAGNVSETSVTYYKTTLNPNGGSVSPRTVLTREGSAFPLPTPVYDNHSFKSWGAKAEDLSEDGYSPKTNATLTAVWS